MRRLFTLVVAAAFFGLPTAGFAQAKKGDKELSVSGNVSTQFISQSQGAGRSDSSGNAFLGIGVFTSDRTQIGFAPSVNISQRTDGSGISADLGISTNVQFYMGAQSSRVKPYVGYSLQIRSFKTAEGGSIADQMYNAGVFGVKNYFSERAALDLNASYGFAVKSADAQRLDFRIGITYLF